MALNGSLFRNKFNGITKLVCRDFKLENFTAVYNNIQYISFTNLNIRRIEFHYFEKLYELTELSITFNNIGRIENNTFKDLSNLTKLYINNNNITSISSEAFKGLYSLIILYINFNSLSVLNAHTFRISTMIGFNLTKTIRGIRLRRSELQIIESRSFIFDNMTVIDLSFNRITSIEKNAFEIKIIENIYLYGNKLSTISRQVFCGINIIQILTVSYNEIECDCGLYWIKNHAQMMNHLNKRVNKNITCGKLNLLKYIEDMNCYITTGKLYIYIYVLLSIAYH